MNITFPDTTTADTTGSVTFPAIVDGIQEIICTATADAIIEISPSDPLHHEAEHKYLALFTAYREHFEAIATEIIEASESLPDKVTITADDVLQYLAD